MAQPGATLTDVRKQFPQYNDLSDGQLADALYRRFYSDMPRQEFDRKVNAPLDVDWSQSTEQVRSRIAMLPEADRQRARRQWAEARVGQERSRGGAIADAARNLPRVTPAGMVTGLVRDVLSPEHQTPTGIVGDVMRNTDRGTIVGPWLDEARAGVRGMAHEVSGGRLGAPADEAVEFERATDRAIDRDRPIVGAGAQIAGALAGGGATYRTARALGLPGLTGRTLPQQVAFGVPFGAAHAFNYGAGTSEGTPEERIQAGTEAAPMGAMFGAGAPLALRAAGAVGGQVQKAVSPTLARWGAQVQELPRRFGIHASADGAPPPAGASAAAEQTIANQLMRAGRSVEDLEGQLARHEQSRTAYPGKVPSRGADVVAPVDLDESLARLAGSAARSSPEAANIGGTFMTARQTGHTPRAPLHEGAGLPTREAMSPQITGKQARRLYGTSFGAALRNPIPMGQRERVSDMLRRDLVIRDAEHHGHLPSAHRTLLKIQDEGKKASDQAYGNFRLAAEGYNVRKHIDPVLQAIEARAASADVGPTTQRLLQQVLREFRPRGQTVSSMTAFDEAKRAIDAVVEKAMRAGDTNVARVLSRAEDAPLRQLLAAVDKIKDRKIGERYAAARGVFHDNKKVQDAFALGREAAREGSEVGADRYAALASDTERKAFRLGLWQHYDERMSALKPTDNVTNIFKQRDLDLLANVIPRTTTPKRGQPTGEFGDRPERFGRYLDTERRFVTETSQIARGGSATARNLADDQALEGLHTIGETFSRLRQGGTVTAMVVNTVSDALNKMFGMRADTAREIARQLFTADPAQRQRVLNNLRMRMGKNRFEHFMSYMNELQPALAGAGIRGGVQAGAE